MNDTLEANLAQSALKEFLDVCGVARPSGHCEAIREHLCRWADSHGLPWGSDGGNVWIDAPATPGFEDSPKMIIQGHMDMVCVADPGVDIDFATTPITVVREGDLVHACGTTLGADDGVGLAFGLAVAASGEGHGPVRVLATYDEETTMAGAQTLSPEVLDADYLVNIDMDSLGKVVVSSAGVLEGTFEMAFETAAIDPEAEQVVTLELSGFMGGHSGGQIHRGLVNAIDEACDAALALIGQGVPARLVALNGGSAANAIPAFATLALAVPREQLEQAVDFLSSHFDEMLAKHAEESEGRVEVCPLEHNAGEAVGAEQTEELLALVREMPRGVLKMSPVMEGLVQTSANLGVARLEGGKVSLCMTARSCEDADLEALLEDCLALAQRHGAAFVEPLTIPAWPARAENRLADLMVEGFEADGIESCKTAVHGGLEPCWFCRKRPGIQLISVGPTFWGEHSPAETLDASTFEPFAKALLHVMRSL